MQSVDPRLIITTIGYSLSAVFSITLALFVYFKAPKRPLNSLFLLMNLAIATFQVSHVVGINIHDPVLSSKVFMFNTANIFLSLFICHWIFVLIGKDKEFKGRLIAFYVVGIALFIFYILFPSTFLHPSVPKLYLPNYYVPGEYQWIMRLLFNVLLPAYFLGHFIAAFRREKDPIQKNRLLYPFVGLLFGFVVGSTAILLVYNIPFDPMWSLFFGLYPIGFAYAILKYELMDIKVLAKKATMYALLVSVLMLLLSGITLSNEYIRAHYPGLPFLVIPIFVSLMTVAIGWFIRRKVNESEVLKYEFMNIITHKFRTPLTQIKWSIEELVDTKLPLPPTPIAVIRRADSLLVELTNSLIALGDSEASHYLYSFKRVDINDLVKDVYTNVGIAYHDKKVESELVLASEPLFAAIDKNRIRFVLETLFENALNYTPAQGKVYISVRLEGKKIIISCKDTGIGVPKGDQPYIFSKFYRSSIARLADTEGVGIGLYMARLITRKNGGDIGFDSSGKGLGSTFYVTLPRVY